MSNPGLVNTLGMNNLRVNVKQNQRVFCLLSVYDKNIENLYFLFYRKNKSIKFVLRVEQVNIILQR